MTSNLVSNEESSIREGIVPRVAYLALGSNLGDRNWHLGEAIARLRAHDRIRVRRVAPIYETAPMYVTEQPEFLNTAAEIETTLDPFGLLGALLDIEEEMGREREVTNGPRIIDIDILFYQREVIDEEGLVIPHPSMLERDFVLKPLADLAPDLVHPETGRTVRDHLHDLVG
jgi:2-amino-4-hydroxy-6-hydroxymethyldihydropteridine diphosphokinase